MNLRVLLNKKLRKLYQKFENVYKKSCAIGCCGDLIENLVLGSSHGYYGFRAEEKDFNLCVESQDLYYSYKLYEKYANLPNLKNIVLFYSVFSTGFDIEKTGFASDVACYKFFFNIHYKDLPENSFTDIEKNLNFIFPSVQKLKKYNGNNEKYKNTPKSEANLRVRIEPHLRENRRDSFQEKYIEKMSQIANEHKHNLFVCIAPARKDYVQLSGDKKYLFRNLYKINDLNIIDCFDITEIKDNDFVDTDHLNMTGAKKLTKIIKKYIAEVNNEL